MLVVQVLSSLPVGLLWFTFQNDQIVAFSTLFKIYSYNQWEKRLQWASSVLAQF